MKKAIQRLKDAVTRFLQEAIRPVVRVELNHLIPPIRPCIIDARDVEMLVCEFTIPEQGRSFDPMSIPPGSIYEDRLRRAKDQLFQEVMRRVEIDAEAMLGDSHYRKRIVRLSLYVKKP